MKKLISNLIIVGLIGLGNSMAGGSQVKGSDVKQEGWTDLLDEKLSKWEVWTAVPHSSIKELPEGYSRGENAKKAPPIGLSDPYKIYTTTTNTDGEVVMKVSGKVYGGLTSKKEYENYHLSLEVKWGETKWAPRKDKKRDSGILYHCTGKHGAMWNTWMRSIELQIMEADFGDLFLLGGPSAMVNVSKDLVWNPSDEAQERKGNVARAIRSVDAESPYGEWTKIDLYVLGDSAIHVINDTVVMAISEAKVDGKPLKKGEIQIQSEGAECYFKNMKIRSIEEFPESVLKHIKGR